MKMLDYRRKSYGVQAIRLTELNIREVAENFGCDYSEEPNGFGSDTKTPVPNIMILGKRTFIGDWVVNVEGELSPRFYTHEEFMHKFWTHAEEEVADEKYARVYQLVQAAMSKQDAATYHGDGYGDVHLVAVEVTKAILGEI